MNQENRECQNCKKTFTIEPEDFLFYEKIKVPLPTFCPECRLQRRFAWRNERSYYKRTCDLCKKNLISTLNPTVQKTVYCNDCWWSDKWDPMVYGREYNFSMNFFEQFKELLRSVPWINMWGFTNVNAEYTNYTGYSKNVYLSASVVLCENIYYSNSVDKSKDIFDTFVADESELLVNSVNVRNIHRGAFLIKSRQCLSSYFLFDCVNCQDCFMSSNVRNKKYYFRNQQFSKDDYENALKEIDFGSYNTVTQLIEEHAKLMRSSLHKFANITNAQDVIGDDIENSKNVKSSFVVSGSENIRYCWRLPGEMKDCYDISGALQSELVYEGVVAANHNYLVKFYSQFRDSKDSSYCILGKKNANVFGCVGCQDKQYSILNKQYTKEEYESLVPKIIDHMNAMPYVDSKGRVYKYGEFFPPDLSPFAYNETIAQEYFPLTKDEAEAQGFRWKDPEARRYTITKKSEDLPDHIKDVNDSITNEIIECAHNASPPAGGCNEQCTQAFKIISEELTFYRRMNLPLPRLCPNCRHYQRLTQRNPLELWHRRCMCNQTDNQRLTTNDDKQTSNTYTNTTAHFHGDAPCPNEFETSYSPERKEIVYCEQCYNAEIV